MPVPTDYSRHTELADWLTANGIEPNTVPVDGDLTIVDTDAGRAIRVETMIRTKDGRLILNDRGTGEAREIRTVPLIVEPPAWWTPYEKPTRETLLAAVEKVRALHRRNEHTSDCEHCSEHDYPDYAVPWPCPTMTALGEKPPAEDPAEDLSPAKPGTPRCTATYATDHHGTATCWRAAVHNDREGCELHLGEAEDGFRYQWLDGGPGTTPHASADPKES